MFQKIFLIYHLILLISADSGENLNQTNVQNKTIINGKTYFLQFRKTGDGEDPEKPIYTRINYYKSEKYKNDDSIAQNLEELPKKEDNEDNTLMGIDKDWVINKNRTLYDLPNITYEVYDAMKENNKHNTIINASTVKFFFEIDTNYSSNIINFNLESIGNITNKVIDAELHVYRMPRDQNTTKPNSTENVVRLYQMTESVEDSNATTPKSVPDVHKLANVIYISSNYAGWQVFKVKNVVENWLSGEENLGFLISTVDSWDKEDQVDFAHRERNGGKYQPVLVVYMNDTQSATPRSLKQNKLKDQLKQMKLSEVTSKSFNPCSRHVWYVSFHELGWNNFIIAPSGFMANKCSGSCKSTVARTYTNHGKLKKMFHQRSKHPKAPCCVPNEYESLLIMYYDADSNVAIKEYDDMIVNSCGCR